MMSFICLVVLATLILFSMKVSKVLKLQCPSLCTTFMIYWFVIVFFSSLRWYRFYEISALVYALVIFGCFFFFIGYSVIGRSLGQINGKSIIKESSNRLIIKHNVFYYILLIGSLVIVIKQIMLLLPVIIVSGMADARSEMQIDDTMQLPGYGNVLLFYYGKPFITASIVVLLANSIRKGFKLEQVLITIVLAMAYFLSEGGRRALVDLLIAFIYLFYINRKRLSSKTLKYLKVGMAIFAGLPILATLERDVDFIEGIYIYYCGGLQYLTEAIRTSGEIFSENLYGWASYQGFLKPFFGISEFLGIEKPDIVISANDFILTAQSTVLNISPNITINYFMTIFGYGYKDGGIFGVCLIMLLYGIMCYFVDIKERNNIGDIRWESIKVVFFFSMLYSMSTAPFSSYLNPMTLIYIVVVTCKYLGRTEKIELR